MLPRGSTSNSNNDKSISTTSNSNRRYSLFNSSTTPLSNLFTATSQVNERNSLNKKPIGRRNTCEMATATATVCQRCKRYEVDLTNTSDNLNATDDELKASRQVISLLQRQLELFRVEKEGLEKLIISQTSNSINQLKALPNESLNQDHELLIDTSIQSEDIVSLDSIDKQKALLGLIQTQVYAKDEEIVKLKFSLKEAQNDKEQLKLQLHLLEEDNDKLKIENSVLSENLALRDQTIVSLSNEVFEQSNLNDLNVNLRRQSSGDSGNTNQILFKSQRHIAKLIDTLDAYKKTNELLSTNVMKLTDRCSQAEKKEVETRSQCHELEAKCCQIQSKLLSLLKEIEQSNKQTNDGDVNPSSQEVICSESVRLLIKRLLEDKSLDIPLSWKEGNKPIRDNNKDEKNSNSKYECDELGFYIEVGQNYESPVSNSSSQRNNSISKIRSHNENSSIAASQLETVDEAIEVSEQEIKDCDYQSSSIRRGNLRQISIDATKNDEASWHIRWDNFIKDFDKIDLTKSKDFKCLLRSGVPQEYRCKIWKSLVDLRVGKERQSYGPDYYQSLLEPNRPQSNSKKSLNSSSKQIELDLLRTLPNNKHFENLDSSGTVRLRKVLTAYSEHNPKVGYCQGMNRLAAVALLVLPEEEAFWCLSTIIDHIMPTGYYNDLWLAQVDSSVVMDFVSIKLPNLSDHFRKNGIDLSLFAWFLTIFVDGTPPALFLRLWDSFLYEGDKILFRVALALLRMYESKLLTLNNSVSINNFLRSTVNAPMDIDQFFDIAFNWINPLSTRSLKAKRQHNFQLMRSGFECAGRSFVTPSPAISEEDKGRQNSNYDDESPFEDSSIISI